MPAVEEYTRGSAEFMALLHNTQTYRAELKKWDSYQSWLRGRNPERAALESKIGWDSKHGSHCVRLLNQGIEILEKGKLVVNREVAGDADYLRDIRRGNVCYEEVINLSNTLMANIEESYRSSKLPEKVDYEVIDKLQIRILKEQLQHEWRVEG